MAKAGAPCTVLERWIWTILETNKPKEACAFNSQQISGRWAHSYGSGANKHKYV